MIRMILRFAVSVLGSALGLWICSLVLDGMSVSAGGFLLAALIFTISTAILQPFFMRMAVNHATYLQGGTALVTTLAGLIITDVFSDGLSISGASTWILATLIVWLATMLLGLLLPALLLKTVVDNRRDGGQTFGR